MKKPVLHQLKTKEERLAGMSYVIECGNGELVVIDGAMPEDGEELYQYLRKLSGKEVPEVAAWIITHLHIDHDGAFMELGKTHARDLRVKQLVCRYPKEEMMARKEPAVLRELPLLEQAIGAFGCERIIPTAGDRYTFGAVELEVLFTCAEFPEEATDYNINDTSTVLRLHAEGQTVLFLGDSEPPANKIMMARHGKNLKSDVVQLAHHGCNGSCRELYTLVDADYVLWPSKVDWADSERVFYHYPYNRAPFLHNKDTFIAGFGTRSWELPLQADPVPYQVKIPDFHRSLVPDFVIKKALTLPDLQKPEDPAWEQAEALDLFFSWEGERKDARGSLRVLWSEEALYWRVEYEKSPMISDPEIFGVDSCHNLRLHLAELPIADLGERWQDVEGDPAFIKGLLVYPEKKRLPGGEGENSDSQRCESHGFLGEDRYVICAALRLVKRHREGELIGFHVESNAVAERGGKRCLRTSFCREELPYLHLKPYRLGPGGIPLWELGK